MDSANIQLPSNRKFGLFFTVVFLIAGLYCQWLEIIALALPFFAIAVILFLISMIKADLLLPLNRLWMKFGFLLGMIVSPLVLGIMFFGIFTPIGLLMRLFGRDELHIKFCDQASYWKIRDKHSIKPDTFKNQF